MAWCAKDQRMVSNSIPAAVLSLLGKWDFGQNGFPRIDTITGVLCRMISPSFIFAWFNNLTCGQSKDSQLLLGPSAYILL